ncbi:MAG: tripartite tricarboxylate transporter substrate binding protein, partial [Burkholderiales bacterium]
MSVRCLYWLFAIALALLTAGVYGQTASSFDKSSVGSAQAYPTKPIRLITSAPGGTSDFTSRIIGRGLTENLGQQVIVDNRGDFGGGILAKAPADGYTLLLDGASLWLAQLLQQTTYDPLRDLTPIMIAVRAPNVVIVNPAISIVSVKELIASARAKPGELNYASGGIGGQSHLAAELFRSMTGVNIVNINYKGTGPAINALVAGEVQIMFCNATIAAPHIKAGKVKALAVGSPERSPLLPDLPTLAASGLPGFESVVAQGIVVPARTPPALVNRINQEIARVLNKSEVKERHFSIGVETVASSPEEFAVIMRRDIERWGKVIKD